MTRPVKPAGSPSRRWWRRGESNSRPKQCPPSFYARVLSLILANGKAGRQAHPEASNHDSSSHGRPATRPPAGSASRRFPAQQTSAVPRRAVLVRPRERSYRSHLGFFLFFNEAHRSPRRATGTSTAPSEPVAPLKGVTPVWQVARETATSKKALTGFTRRCVVFAVFAMFDGNPNVIHYLFRTG